MKEKNRPLSPHLLIYTPQITSIISIFHRITGTVLALTYLLSSIYFLYLATFIALNNYCNFVYSLVNLVLIFLWFLLLFTLFFHMSNGVRHITWDFGLNLEINSLTTSGLLVISLSFLFLFLTILF